MIKSQLRYAAQRIRHVPGLDQMDFVWNSLRRSYQALLRVGDGGVRVNVGGVCEVLMPPEYSAGSWEAYEPSVIAALVEWVKDHPKATVLDIGSSVGIMSAVALSSSPQARVIAFDSDLASLKATQRLTSLVGAGRLRLVSGFVSNKHLSGHVLGMAEQHTEKEINASGVSGNVGTTNYICLQDNFKPTIPYNSLDGLMLNEASVSPPILVKCDIEGAEQLAVEGGREWLKTVSPPLLLSVHPDALPLFRHSKEGLRDLLSDLRYQVKILAVDHEEHWWCERYR